MPSTHTHNLVTLTDPRSPAAEAFRSLRTNLMFSSLERPLTTLLVTSTAAEEGKSTTLANLAVTMAQGGRKTIIVDCDLRRPHRVGMLPAARVTDGCDMVDVDAEAEVGNGHAQQSVSDLQVIHPVLDLETSHPPELTFIVRDKGKIESHSVSGDPEIV